MAFANHLCGSRDRMDLHLPELDFSQPICRDPRWGWTNKFK